MPISCTYTTLSGCLHHRQGIHGPLKIVTRLINVQAHRHYTLHLKADHNIYDLSSKFTLLRFHLLSGLSKGSYTDLHVLLSFHLLVLLKQTGLRHLTLQVVRRRGVNRDVVRLLEILIAFAWVSQIMVVGDGYILISSRQIYTSR